MQQSKLQTGTFVNLHTHKQLRYDLRHSSYGSNGAIKAVRYGLRSLSGGYRSAASSSETWLLISSRWTNQTSTNYSHSWEISWLEKISAQPRIGRVTKGLIKSTMHMKRKKKQVNSAVLDCSGGKFPLAPSTLSASPPPSNPGYNQSHQIEGGTPTSAVYNLATTTKKKLLKTFIRPNI